MDGGPGGGSASRPGDDGVGGAPEEQSGPLSERLLVSPEGDLRGPPAPSGRWRAQHRRGRFRPGKQAGTQVDTAPGTAAAPEGSTPEGTAPEGTARTDPAEERRLAVTLVRRLLPVAARLQGVHGVSDAVVGAVLERVPAEAAALLLPDDGEWAVQAGLELRPLERRARLGASHWLVSQVVQGRHGVLVEDTDIARARLEGSPLASWRNLLAAPLPVVDGLLLLARSRSRFAAEDLASVGELLSTAGERLAEAMETRDLARLLEPLAERA